ncbi:MAG: spore maturation protein, partial [Thermoleophilia bacterium]|nr:spore maturation protein [Thermoleophilia bacterium]
AIWMPTLFATFCSTAAAIATYYALKPLPLFALPRRIPTSGGAAGDDRLTADPGAGVGSKDTASDPTHAQAAASDADDEPSATAPPKDGEPRWRSLARRGLVLLALLAFAASIATSFQADRLAVGLGAASRNLLQHWTLPALLLAVLVYGFSRRVPVYDSMVAGGREALEVASRIVPYLVVILVAVGMLRASGALDAVIGWIDPFTSRIGVPAEVLPMALIRPLSGSGALGVMSEIITTHGPDSFIGMLTCTIMGSTETTFYVLAVYFGAAGVVDGRHALACCLMADLAGFLGAVAACRYFFG